MEINSLAYHTLDVSERPPELKSVISDLFEDLAYKSECRWFENGLDYYHMANVEKFDLLLKKVILGAPKEQKEFYVLDIGAANFQWGSQLAQDLDRMSDLPDGIKIHIIGVRGEKYAKEEAIMSARCEQHRLGAFKVEELMTQFRERGFNLENKVDLVVSRWTFRHLADPVGTFAQTYNLLRPKTGFLFIDGFFFDYESQGDNEAEFGNPNMVQLFLDTGAPFLKVPFSDGHSMDHFILQKPDERSCPLKMSYRGMRYPGFMRCNRSTKSVTLFRREPQESDTLRKANGRENRENALGNNKELYEWFETNALFFYQDRFPWKPVLK